MSVLIVDDDFGTREIFERILSTVGIAAMSAETGEDGLRLARAYRPELLLTDLRLPDMSGVALLRALRADGNGLAVVIMTAFGSAASAVEAMKLGALDYIEKPIDVDDLLRIVASTRRAPDSLPDARTARRFPPATACVDLTTTNFRIHQISEIVNRRFDRPDLTLESVARDLGVTAEHICRLLRRFTGTGFTAHLRRARVAAAQQLLAKTTLSAKEIAFRVGFTSVSRLDRDFKRVCGVPPTVYRRVAVVGVVRASDAGRRGSAPTADSYLGTA